MHFRASALLGLPVISRVCNVYYVLISKFLQVLPYNNSFLNDLVLNEAAGFAYFRCHTLFSAVFLALSSNIWLAIALPIVWALLISQIRCVIYISSLLYIVILGMLAASLSTTWLLTSRICSLLLSPSETPRSSYFYDL